MSSSIGSGDLVDHCMPSKYGARPSILCCRSFFISCYFNQMFVGLYSKLTRLLTTIGGTRQDVACQGVVSAEPVLDAVGSIQLWNLSIKSDEIYGIGAGRTTYGESDTRRLGSVHKKVIQQSAQGYRVRISARQMQGCEISCVRNTRHLPFQIPCTVDVV